LVVLCASCSGKAKDEGGATSGETQASTATTGAGAEGTPQARGKGVDALVDLIVAQAAELPRAEFDPAALAQQLGKDPKRISNGCATTRGGRRTVACCAALEECCSIESAATWTAPFCSQNC
jgi:hypothetical protein